MLPTASRHAIFSGSSIHELQGQRDLSMRKLLRLSAIPSASRTGNVKLPSTILELPLRGMGLPEATTTLILEMCTARTQLDGASESVRKEIQHRQP